VLTPQHLHLSRLLLSNPSLFSHHTFCVLSLFIGRSDLLSINHLEGGQAPHGPLPKYGYTAVATVQEECHYCSSGILARSIWLTRQGSLSIH